MCAAAAVPRLQFWRHAAAALLATLSMGALPLSALPLSAQAADLTVSAAASLSGAFRDIAPLFEAQNPGTQLLLNFGPSDGLLAQIAKGAPADVFASADTQAMDRAHAQKLLTPGSRFDFTGNTLVLITPSDSSLVLKTLADLQKPEVKRIGLGIHAAPFGRYSKSALESAGLWAAAQARGVFAQNVRQSLDYVARGEVDAGFVYATDAAAQKDKVKVAFSVPTATPITYPIGAIAGSPNPDAARKFIDFVLAPAGQAVLARHGFRKP